MLLTPTDFLPGLLTEEGAGLLGTTPGPVLFRGLEYSCGQYIVGDIWRDNQQIGGFLALGPTGVQLVGTGFQFVEPVPPTRPKPRRISVQSLGMVIDFTQEDTRQFHRDLCEVYNTEEHLVALLQRLGVGQGDIPFKSTLRDTWQAVLIDLNNRMKIGQLLSLVSW